MRVAPDTPVIAATAQPQQGMRVLMISDVYFPRVNGVSTSIATFRQRCTECGVHIDLLAPDYGHAQCDEIGVTRVAARAVWGDPEDRMMRYRVLIRAGTKAGPYDLVHVQTPFVAHYAGVRLARTWGVPVVATYHTYFEQYLHHYVPLVPGAAMRALARRFSRTQCSELDALVVPSRQMLETLRGYGVVTPAEVIPTGVGLRQFGGGDGARFRLRHGIARHRPLLLFVGRVAHEKNIAFLIEVVDRLRHFEPEVLLLIAGEGPAQRGLQRLVDRRRLHHHVAFVGYLSRQSDLHDCYSAGDVFVFASPTETQGLVLVEAMASGLATVSTAVMGTHDVLRGACGALISPQAVEPFAQRVLLLLRDPALRLRLARAARRDAKGWSDRSAAQRLTAFYRRLLGVEAGIEV